MNEQISILVPCCNVEKYVRQCLDSIAAQTYRNLEIICIDDGSVDSTGAVIDEYASKDPRFRVIHKPNSGYGDSMNKGLEMATGEYIGIVESDDWVEPDMFERLYRKADAERLDIARCCYFENRDGVDTVVRNEWVPKNRVLNPSMDQSVLAQAPAIWVNLVRRSLIERNGIRFLPTPGASFQDTSFAFKLYACADRFAMIDVPLLHYRINAGSSVVNLKKVLCVCDEWQEIYRFVKSRAGSGRKALLDILPFLQNGTYKWNYERLEGEPKYRFLKRWQSELIDHINAGDIDWKALDSELACKLKKIAYSADSYYRETGGELAAAGGRTEYRPLVSVVVPVYNCEKYIGDTLRSITGQSYTNIEILCVDDCSTDNGWRLVEEIASEDNRVRLVRHETNRGRSAARNSALDIARGEWIACVDGDDLLPPEAIGKMVSYADDTVDAVFAGIDMRYEGDPEKYGQFVDSDKAYYTVPYTDRHIITVDERVNFHLSCSAKLFRRRLIVENGLRFPVGLNFEDAYWNWCYFSICTRPVQFVADSVYTYIRHFETSIMSDLASSARRGVAIQHLRVLDAYYEFLEKRGEIEKNRGFLNCLYEPYFWFAFSKGQPNERALAISELTEMLIRHNVDAAASPFLAKVLRGDVAEFFKYVKGNRFIGGGEMVPAGVSGAKSVAIRIKNTVKAIVRCTPFYDYVWRKYMRWVKPIYQKIK